MSEQNNILKTGRTIIQPLLNLFKPDIPKIVLFALLCSLFLIIKNQVFLLPAGQACPLSAMDTTYTGLPFSFYSYDRLQNSHFDYVNLLINILIYYSLACLLVTFVCFGVNSCRGHKKNRRLIFLTLSINIVVIAFVSIKIMAPDWLVKSVRSQQKVVVNTLLILGTSPNAVSFKHRHYALHEAVIHNNSALTALLINYGATVNRHDSKGRTALHIAVARNAIDASRVLLKSGANPNARDQNGRSSAHFACSLAMAKLLHRHKANPNITDKDQKRAEDIAPNPLIKKYWASKSTAKKLLKPKLVSKKNTQAPPNTNKQTPVANKAPSKETEILARKSLTGCTHSLGGSLFANGQEYSIKISASGTIVAYSGMHSFAYAKCRKKGYFHILVKIKGQKPLIYKNLFHESGESEPLSFSEKQTVLIHLSVASTKAKVYWYFSERKIKNLLKTITSGKVAQIGRNKLTVIAVRKRQSKK